MQNGCTVLSYTSGDKWFGMTYTEDRPEVMARLKELHENGAYPDCLFD